MPQQVLLPATLRVLELQRVLEQIGEHTQTPLGMAWVLSRRPSGETSEVRCRLARLRQVRELVQARGPVPVAGAVPLAELLARVRAAGTVIEPAEALSVAATARAAERVRRRYVADVQRWPEPAALAQRLTPLDALVGQIEGVLTARGEVREDASPRLRRLRRQIRTRRRAVRERLDRLVQQDSLRDVLRDRLVTERAGRLVVPVRSDHRDSLPGIVHDASGSRQTVFVEPQQVVEDQNELVALEGQEREEIRRLLAELTAHVRAATPALAVAEEVIAEVDGLQAIDRHASDVEAVEPLLVDQGLRLVQARHPLIDRAAFVPLDLDLPEDVGGLVVTGPNTGGKTVTLKTVGVLCLMAQCGLPVPAVEARLPVFRRVHADIGDEQSLTANLSTFSGHIAHIIEFLASCPKRSLILLDELGTGTDPAEGAALGIALLERFLARGATVLASTHHDALKAFAHGRDDLQNAAMEFDPETLAPTYRIRVGRPGRSNALEIAERLGLEPGLIERARSLLEGDAVRLDQILRDLEEQARQLDQGRQALEQASRELEERQHRWQQEQRHQQRVWEQTVEAARRQIDREVRAVREEGAKHLRDIERDTPSASPRVQADRRARWAASVGEMAGRSRRRIEALKAPAAGENSRRARPPRGAEERQRSTASGGSGKSLHRGDPVRVAPFGLEGTLLGSYRPGDAGPLEVDVGGKRLLVQPDQIEPATARVRRARAVSTQLRSREAVSSEIDLHGKTVEQALQAVDKYLDDAALAGLSTVRLIHGLGTGRLRHAIHAWLAKRPDVASFALAEPGSGGAGVTIVQLED